MANKAEGQRQNCRQWVNYLSRTCQSVDSIARRLGPGRLRTLAKSPRGGRSGASRHSSRTSLAQRGLRAKRKQVSQYETRSSQSSCWTNFPASRVISFDFVAEILRSPPAQLPSRQSRHRALSACPAHFCSSATRRSARRGLGCTLASIVKMSSLPPCCSFCCHLLAHALSNKSVAGLHAPHPLGSVLALRPPGATPPPLRALDHAP